MVKKKEIFLFFALLILSFFIVYVYHYIAETKNEIFVKIENDKIQQILNVYKNIKDDTLKNEHINTADGIYKFLENKQNREKQEEKLSTLLSSSVKYIYILTKDKKGRYRFLLDASKIDKANFYQKFDVDSPKYDEVYKTKKAQILRHKNMENLCLTYLYPLIIDDKVVAIFTMDITNYLKKDIDALISPLESFFMILIVFIFLLMIMTIIQVLHYFITKKKIFTDPLTQLYNRNYLQEITPMLNLKNYSIAMLDLDRFKMINDTYGHKTGDYILSKSSEIFKSSIRESDILIRYGGEEFLLFIDNKHSDKTAFEICEDVRKHISLYNFKYDNNDIKMQVSIGIHKNPHLEKNLTEAIKLADKMLYIAKSEGRNRVITYSESSEKSIYSRTKGIDFVKEALENDRVYLYYQPIYNYKTGKIYKYEALVRIIDIDNKVISPIFFLPDLKHTNIHYKLTQRILSIVFIKFKQNTSSVSINLNFSDLINHDIETTIINELKDNKELASRITFEILESDEIADIKLFKEKIDILHRLGSKISIDDFGSGYSNFRTILDIEANILKIDGSLIKNIDKNSKDFKVVKSIINFAKEAGMKTVAEFVHSKDVYDKLVELDVDYMQGYYIAQPSVELLQDSELFKD